MKFSETEVSELMRAWIAISLAFAIALGGGINNSFMTFFFMAGVTVGIAFLVHEIAHKYVAQMYGCWAEFRSFPLGLAAAVLLSLLTSGQFLFAAPGAVMIRGIVTTEENGKISAAGPISNLILAALFYVGIQFMGVAVSAIGSPSFNVLLYQFLATGYMVNAWLAMFNLLPFGPLDGVKIMRWNPMVWGVLIAVSAFATFMV